ncbi:C-type lectin domain family 7 member A-like [Tachyglossus aculeatus]|uniref:C-type lectin domain family 7 member A-like n=1 Tax=Tachyglossus aculeatus TaxID=9261 RepID=UPI0018F63F14|nr:C-type lectin domain family 7 member A-like [Tachyglossus aculeatus]
MEVLPIISRFFRDLSWAGPTFRLAPENWVPEAEERTLAVPDQHPQPEGLRDSVTDAEANENAAIYVAMKAKNTTEMQNKQRLENDSNKDSETNENAVIYEEMKLNDHSKKWNELKAENGVNEQEMNQVEMTICPIVELQSKEPSGNTKSQAISSWQLTVMMLGILSFIFLVTSIVLGSLGTYHSLRMGSCYHYGEKYYRIFQQSKTWNDSRDDCIARGSTLLHVENMEELEFIQTKLQGFSWIGLTRQGLSSPWIWVNGSPLSSALNIPEPNQKLKNCCGIMSDYSLYAQACQNISHYVCEKKFCVFALE